MDLFTIFVSGIIMLLLDFIYLSSVTKAYSEQIAKIQRTAMNIKLEGAALCYFFLILDSNQTLIAQQTFLLF